MESVKYDDDSGEITMRADNHQVIQPLYISTLVQPTART